MFVFYATIIYMTVTRLFDYLYYQFDQYPMQRAFGRRDGKDWLFYSTEDLIVRSRKLAAGLLNLGIQRGDKVAMVAYTNRPEWIVVDLATQYIGAVNVPLYPTISTKEYIYILQEAEVKAVFVGVDDLFDKVANAATEVPSLQHIYTFDQQEGKPFWESIYDDSKLNEVESISNTITSDDLATIIYTSGTTGNPKGVMLTHRNMITVIDETLAAFPISQGDRTISFLPFCHVFERAVIYGYLLRSCEVYCVGTQNLGGEQGDLMAVRPQFFTTVPRLLEKVYEKIYHKGQNLTGIKKFLFFWALKQANDFELYQPVSGLKAIKRKIADRLIFSKWRAALGGSLKAIVTGAAPCPEMIARVFSAAGIPILEGYGLTETSPTISINRYGGEGAKLGTVGPLIPSVDVKIDLDEEIYGPGAGEILAKGPNIMQGYYKKEEATHAVFKEIDGEKWFCTGDIGKFVDGPNNLKYLKITDRKKELLKTSGGKYVAPAPIESKFKEDILIEQMMVIGDQRKFVSALIVPAAENLLTWCANNDLKATTVKEAIALPEVQAYYQRKCDKINPQFSHIEQVKRFTLLADPWEPLKADGSEAELTPTLKLKRRVITEKYAKEIDQMYQSAD